MFSSRRTRAAPMTSSPRHHHTTTHTTRSTRSSRGGLFSGRRRSPRRTMGTSSRSRHAHTTHSAIAPVHHQRRKPSMKDKISGALLKLKGSLTNRPGQKAAGTRRMHGTDGRGSRRVHRTRYQTYCGDMCERMNRALPPPHVNRRLYPAHRGPPPPPYTSPYRYGAHGGGMAR